MARLAVALVVLVVIATPAGRDAVLDATDWAARAVGDLFVGSLEEEPRPAEAAQKPPEPPVRKEERPNRRCGPGGSPGGVNIPAREAVEVAVGDGNVACRRVSWEMSERAGRPVWVVEVQPKKPGGCYSATVVDARRGQIVEAGGGCP